jgi:hypothetical protein
MEHYFSSNRKKRILVTFRVYMPGTSAALRGYYTNKVVPDIRDAYWQMGEHMTLKATEKHLREISPICWKEWFDENSQSWQSELREIVDLDRGKEEVRDFDNSELVQHLEFLKQFAAENLSVFIDDPRILKK